MTALEQIGLDKLKIELSNIWKNVSNENEGRQEHLRIFTEGSIKRALEIIKALEENGK